MRTADRAYSVTASALAMFSIIVALMEFGCRQSATEGGATALIHYPLAVGNTWTYRATYALTDFRPSRPGVSIRDSVITTTAVTTITGKRILNDSLDAWEFRTVESDSPASVTTYHYYRAIGDTLFLIAYSNGGIFTPRHAIMKRFSFAGHRTSFIPELFLNFDKRSERVQRGPDGLIYEDSPPKAYVYPILPGNEWTYRKAGYPFRIGHKVIGVSNVGSSGSALSGLTIAWMWDLNADDVWDTDATGLEYVGEKGLLKRDFILKHVRIDDNDGNALGTIQLRQTFEFAAIQLN